MTTVLIIDAANVVGSRPDGWWKDRAGAARRLAARLNAADLDGDRVILVLEGAAKAGMPVSSEGRIEIVHAPKEGDDEIVAQAKHAVDDGARVTVVTVVTADRGLIGRLHAVGAQTSSPGALLRSLPQE